MRCFMFLYSLVYLLETISLLWLSCLLDHGMPAVFHNRAAGGVHATNTHTVMHTLLCDLEADKYTRCRERKVEV